jgi:hypothetical protein
MVDEMQTFREVSISIKGITAQLSLMQKVFLGSVAIIVGCFGYLFYTTTATKVDVARIQEKIIIIDTNIASIDKKLEKLDSIEKSLESIDTKISFENSPNKSTAKFFVSDGVSLLNALKAGNIQGRLWIYPEDPSDYRLLINRDLGEPMELRTFGFPKPTN